MNSKFIWNVIVPILTIFIALVAIFIPLETSITSYKISLMNCSTVVDANKRNLKEVSDQYALVESRNVEIRGLLFEKDQELQALDNQIIEYILINKLLDHTVLDRSEQQIKLLREKMAMRELYLKTLQLDTALINSTISERNEIHNLELNILQLNLIQDSLLK